MIRINFIKNRYVQILCISIFFIVPTFSQSSTAKDLKDSVEAIIPFPDSKVALPIYQRIYDLSEKEGDRNIQLYSKMYISHFQNQLGNNIEADESIENAFEMAKDTTRLNPNTIILTYQLMQGLERKRGNLREANDLNKKYIELELSNGADDVQLGLSYLDLAITYRIFGDFENVILYTDRSFDLFKGANESLFTLQRDKNLRLFKTLQIRALCFKDMKNYQKAIEDYETSLFYLKNSSQYNSKEGIKSRIDCYNRMADVFLHKGEIANAYNSLQKLKPLIKIESYDKFRYYELSSQLSLKKGELPSASNEIKKAIELATIQLRDDKEFPSIARLYMIFGDIYAAKDSLHKAVKIYHKGLQYIDTNLDDNIYESPNISLISEGIQALQLLHKKAEAFYLIYQHFDDVNALKSAIHTYNSTIDLIHKMKSDFINEVSKYKVAEMASSIFQKALQANYELYQMENSESSLSSIYNIIEKNKAEILFQNISNKYNLLTSELPKELIDQGIDLKYNISYYSKLLAEEEIKEEKSNEKITKLEDKLFKLNEAFSFYDEKIKSNYPDFYKFKNDIGNQVSVSDLQKVLRSKEVILEYFQTDNHLYILSVYKDKIEIRRESIKEIEPLINSYFKAISAPPSERKIKIDELNQISRSLANLLFLKDPNFTEKISKIIIIPDGSLNKIPFEALIVNDKGKMLLEQCNISYNYSSNQYYSNIHSERLKDPEILSISPIFEGLSSEERTCNSSILGEIPYAQQESNFLKKKFEGKFFNGTSANITNLKDNFENYPIIHLATHACLNKEDPMLSQIYFSDGAMTSYDIQNLNSRPELVVLSACNTASGRIKNGEGVIGLSRSFFESGVKGMQSSLWSINDLSSSDIVRGMYSYLQKGVSKSEALRLSKLDYLKKADKLRSHPYYWAAIIHIGNDNPIEFSSNKWHYKFLSLAFILLLCLGCFFYIQRIKR